MSDEEKMIEILLQHKALKKAVMRKLRQLGIPCRETLRNDPRGDIILVRRRDIPRVKKIISGWSGKEI